MSTIYLDATGLYCPMPVLRANKLLRTMNSGDHLEVKSTDRNSTKEFIEFCDITGHILIDNQQNNDIYMFIIEKK